MTPFVNRRRLLALLAAPAMLAALGGCATMPSPEADRAALLKRAGAYWAAVQANDRVAAWAFEESSKDPKATLDAYLKRGGITYDAVEVRGVRSLEGDRAVVDVYTKYSLPLLRVKGQEAVVEDEWRRIGDNWYHVQRRSIMFAPG